MPRWEVKYANSTAGAGKSQLYTVEASDRNEVRKLFEEEFPLEEIISIMKVVD